MDDERTTVSEMARAVECLALELPQQVWADVNARWEAAVREVNAAGAKERADERAAIVADLRAYSPWRAICTLLADRYERGEDRG